MGDKTPAVKVHFTRFINKLIVNDFWITPEMRKKMGEDTGKKEAKELTALTPLDKRLINIPVPLRTVAERKRVLKIFSDLECMEEYSPKIRARLARCATYVELKPDRMVLMERTMPLMAYFLIAGKVDTFHHTYNDRKQKWIKGRDILNILGSGAAVGVHSIYWNAMRRNCCMTLTSVDAIVVQFSDLREIVMPYWRKHWDEKVAAVKALPYFENFDQFQINEACKLCALKKFEVYDTIYSKDGGSLSEVFFVLSGECMIVQNLKMLAQTRRDRKVYKLTEAREVVEPDPADVAEAADAEGTAQPSTQNDDDNSDNNSVTYSDNNYYDEEDVDWALRDENTNVFDAKAAFQKCKIRMPYRNPNVLPNAPRSRRKASGEAAATYHYILAMDSESVDSEKDINIKVVKTIVKKKVMKNFNPNLLTRYAARIKDSDINDYKDGVIVRRKTGLPGTMRMSYHSSSESMEFDHCEETEDRIICRQKRAEMLSSHSSDIEDDDSVVDNFNEDLDIVKALPDDDKERGRESGARDSKGEVSYAGSPSMGSGSIGSQNRSTCSSASSVASSVFSDILSEKIEMHLIDVGTIRCNGIFGLGEKSFQRTIVARSNVQVLTLPRFWLFQRAQNSNGVWRVRRQMIEQSIPSRERIFEMWVKEQAWPKFKKKYVDSVLDPDTIANGTQLEDIPSMLMI